MLSKLKPNLFKFKYGMPYIPDFSDIWNIVKILIVSLYICVIFSFSETKQISLFYQIFWDNIKIFFPYLIFQLILFIFNSKIIKKLDTILAIIYIIILNLIGVYIIDSAINNSFYNFSKDIELTFSKFGISLGILFFFLIYFDWREKSIHPSHLIAKLSFLQSKMRPHFLFNTLNSIVGLIKKEPDTAKKMLLNLSEILRASLMDNQTIMYKLEEELLLCEKYLEIEKMRLQDRLLIKWDVQLELKKIFVPKLSIQPLIENGILHGIQNLENGGVIEISIFKKSINKAIIEIKNSKSPIKKKSNNISINNLIERLNICYNQKISLITKEENNFFIITLEIPIIYNNIIEN